MNKKEKFNEEFVFRNMDFLKNEFQRVAEDICDQIKSIINLDLFEDNIYTLAEEVFEDNFEDIIKEYAFQLMMKDQILSCDKKEEKNEI